MTDKTLVAELRTFILSYGEHDSDCPGFEAEGPAALDRANCTCGFIDRMEDLLAKVAEQLGTGTGKS